MLVALLDTLNPMIKDPSIIRLLSYKTTHQFLMYKASMILRPSSI